ncbi:MAG: LysR family transcriptional regulator [Alphaproteobacteria bacterium]|nr:LysR family transcriptional regulator [Alphaproteobacteria bacterium]
MSRARVTIRLDFDGGRQLGHGKIRLLELIQAHGSISSAAREMKMSYRRAWLLADEVNRMFNQPVFETQLGGKGGGNARLTEFGRELVTLYRNIEEDADGKFATQIHGLEKRLSSGG